MRTKRFIFLMRILGLLFPILGMTVSYHGENWILFSLNSIVLGFHLGIWLGHNQYEQMREVYEEINNYQDELINRLFEKLEKQHDK